MRDAGETWDVFVVGQRDSSHASMVMLAAELSHYTGMATSEVEVALMKGEVRVRAGIERTAAENAAMELDDIGAIVDLRLTDGRSGLFPILKPDALRRSGVAVGGFIDDSATPPALAENSGMTALPLEPDPESLPPPPPMGMPLETFEDIASEPIRVRVPPFGTPSRADFMAAVSGLDRDGPAALGHVDDPKGGGKAIVDVPYARAPDSVPPLMNRASAAPAWINEPPPTAPAPRPRQVAPVTVAPPAASVSSSDLMGDLDALELTELPTAPKKKKKKKPKPATAAPVEAVPASAGPARTGPRPPERLELDFEAAGIQAPARPVAAELPPRSRDAAGSSRTSMSAGSTSAGSMSAGSMSAGSMGAGFMGPASVRPASVRPASVHPEYGDPGYLLGRDNATAIPLGLGLGLLLSLMVVIQLQRGVDEQTFMPLEEELRMATTMPSRVETGEVRPAPKVEAALTEEYERHTRSFLIKWLAIGLPIGFALSRIRRSS